MARPKLGDSESKRLQMVITEDELRAIEDWQFSNRVPSKSEAIRRLVQIGLLVGGELDGLSDTMLELSTELADVSSDGFSMWAEIANPLSDTDKLDRAAVKSALEKLAANLDRVDAGVSDVASVLVALYRAVAGISRSGSVEEGKKFSNAVIEETMKQMDEIHALRLERQKNLAGMKVTGYKGKRSEGADG